MDPEHVGHEVAELVFLGDVDGRDLLVQINLVILIHILLLIVFIFNLLALCSSWPRDLLKLFEEIMELTEAAVNRIHKTALNVVFGYFEDVGVVGAEGLREVRLQVVLDRRTVY